MKSARFLTHATHPGSVDDEICLNKGRLSSQSLRVQSARTHSLKEPSMSTSYQEIQKQIAELQAKAEEARRAELTTARAQIQAIMKEYGLTLADFGGGVKQPKVARKPVEIKYKDDATGNTWTGRGRAPKWIEGKDKNQYLVR